MFSPKTARKHLEDYSDQRCKNQLHEFCFRQFVEHILQLQVSDDKIFSFDGKDLSELNLNSCLLEQLSFQGVNFSFSKFNGPSLKKVILTEQILQI